jgi:thiol-disulfide isomerase/thioredoxin
VVSCATPAQYKALLARATAEGRLLVAKFFTPECIVCKALHPKVLQMASQHPDVLWAKLNGNEPALEPMFGERYLEARALRPGGRELARALSWHGWLLGTVGFCP